jgi:hypothetical protein
MSITNSVLYCSSSSLNFSNFDWIILMGPHLPGTSIFDNADVRFVVCHNQRRIEGLCGIERRLQRHRGKKHAKEWTVMFKASPHQIVLAIW